jgi:FkbM family methyltransferase
MGNLYYTSNYTEFQLLDVYLEEILGIRTDGFFLEIGAFDGQTNSKTARLADIGWQGIYVEPIKEYADKCKERHKANNIEVMHMAIGAKDGLQTMHKGGLPSTLVASNRDHLEGYMNNKGESFHFQTEEVKVLSWGSFYLLLNGKQPDLLVLDAEGYDLTILKSIQLNEFRPKIICCEVFPDDTAFMHPKVIQEGKELINLLQQNGYHLWLMEEHNVMFVDGRSLPMQYADLKHISSTSVFAKLFSKLESKIDNLELEEQEYHLIRFLGGTIFFSQNKVQIEEYQKLLFYCYQNYFSPFLVRLIIKSFLLLNEYEKLNAFVQKAYQEHREIDWLINVARFAEFTETVAQGNYKKAQELLHLLRDSYPFHATFIAQIDLLNKAQNNTAS